MLVKYTYYGDTDFNGIVNFDDYARIDAGFNSGCTGWLNGDLDYNDVVNFDDYALIDLAFNSQAQTLARAVSYLNGDDRNSDGMDTPALRFVECALCSVRRRVRAAVPQLGARARWRGRYRSGRLCARHATAPADQLSVFAILRGEIRVKPCSGTRPTRC